MERTRENDRGASPPPRRGRVLRRFPLAATLAVGLSLWVVPSGSLESALAPCAAATAAKARACPAAAVVPRKRRSPTDQGRGDPGGSPVAAAPNSAHDATPIGGIGLPALIGSLGLMSALAAALAGRGASNTSRRTRPAVAVAAVDD